MKKALSFLFLTLLLASCGSPVSSSPIASSEAPSIEPPFISSEAVESSAQEATSEPAKTSSSEPSSTSLVSSSSSSGSSQSSIAPKPWLKPTDDVGLGDQFYLNSIGDVFQVWETYRGDGQTIAVVDVGFNPYHPEFYYSDGTSKVSPLSASFVTTGTNTTKQVGVEKVVNMGESHGTFCAGVAASAINGQGTVGIAPNASLLLLKTDAKPRSINAAFRYAADCGVKVISVSIGSYYDYTGDLNNDGSDLSTCFDDSVAYCKQKGTVVISAAGNGGLDNHRTEYTYPGAAKGVIGVAGLAANEEAKIWSGSSINPKITVELEERFVDCYAPADQMYGPCHYGNKEYDGGWNGTSFAAPQVAGMAALYFEKNPAASVDDFISALASSCRKFSDGTQTERYNGFGAIDVGKIMGMESKGSITVKVSTNWTNVTAYAWRLRTQLENHEWPGVSMTRINGGYSASIDFSKYDHVIFASGSNQTVNIHVSAFRYGAAYSLTDSGSFEGKRIGHFR